MDGLNNPHFDAERIAAARRWVDEAAGAEEKAGHRFLRYWVGGAPPDDEQRHSAPDTDGGLNGIGAYGGLSFIIEAAVRHHAKDPSADLGKRVDAYLVLFRRFVEGAGHRAGDLAVVERARKLPAAGLSSVGRPLGEPGRDGHGVPGRRGRDGEGAEDPDREPDDRGGGEADRADAARLRGRPGGGARDRRAARPGTASRSRRSPRRGRSRPRAARSSASRRSSTTSTAATAAGRS